MSGRRTTVWAAVLSALCAPACSPGFPQRRQEPARDRPAPLPAAVPLPDEKDLGRRARAHVERILAFGPRVSGSPARRRAADYLCARLRALGLEPIRERWVDPGEKVEFENVRVFLPGRTRKRLLLATHYDTKRALADPPPAGAAAFTGANDGGSGAGLLLALAEDLAPLGLRKPALELLWLDGEESIPPEWDVNRALFGSREFVRRHLRKGHGYGALVLLDMVGHRDLAIDRETTSTARLFPPFEAAVAALGYGKHFFQRRTTVDDDHVPFLDAGLPAIDLIQFEHNPEWHSYRDRLQTLAPRSLAIVGRVVLAALPGIEARFLAE